MKTFRARVDELEAENEALRTKVESLEERRCEVCGYAEHHREHTGCLQKQAERLEAENEALRKELADLKASLGEPVGYWMGEYGDGVAPIYEEKQSSLFGRVYKNIPLYALKETK